MGGLGGRSGWVAWVVGLGGWLGWVTWVGGLGGRPVVRVAGPDDRPESFPSMSRGLAAVSGLTESEPGPSMGHPMPGTVYAGTSHARDCACGDIPCPGMRGHSTPGTVHAGASHAWDCACGGIPCLGLCMRGDPMPGTVHAGTSHAWDCAWRDIPCLGLCMEGRSGARLCMEWSRGIQSSACRDHPMHSCAWRDAVHGHPMHSCACEDTPETSLHAQLYME